MTPAPAPGCPELEVLERLAAGASVHEADHRHTESCAACAGRLASIRHDNELLAEFIQANDDRVDAGAPFLTGAAPEGYEILSEVRRGSQGVVYRAHHPATKRTVALKLSATGAFMTDRQRQRFEREVELIAALRHPNVVTVYDSGFASDGRRFLAMELIEGRPLDVHAREATGAGRDDRLLCCFLKICDAVAAAHRRGIMHRDLKPANILVDAEGEPHVLDFGLAKVVERAGVTAETAVATMAGEFLGTFAYAAPEQVAGDPAAIDTRADVYALGVILYELLGGARPYDLAGSIGDVVQTITGTEPRPLSACRPGVPTDLAVIVRTALHKDPERRYQTVAELAEDVRRFRTGLPISVRREELGYVLRRAARRYRVPLGIAAGFVLLLAAATIVTTVLYVGKVRESRKTRTAIAGLVRLIEATDRENPEVPLAASSIVALLEETSSFVTDELAGLPEVAGPVDRALGLAYLSRGEWDHAERHLRSALAHYRRLHDGPHQDVAQSLHNLGRLAWQTARYDEAIALYGEALEMARAIQPGDHSWTARTMQHLASSHRQKGRLEDAERLFRASIDMRTRLFGPDDKSVANATHGLGNCLYDRGRPADALACFEEARRMIIAHHDELDWRVGRATHNAARCLIDLDRLDDAEVALERSLVVKRRLGIADDRALAAYLHERARLLLRRGAWADAEPLARRALEIREAAYPRPHPDKAATRMLVGRVEAAAGRPAAAKAAMREALEELDRLLGPEHWRTAAAAVDLGVVLIEQGRHEEAAVTLGPAAAVLRRDHDAGSPARRRLEAALAGLDG